MSKIYILTDGKDFMHTYSKNIVNENILKGWKHIMSIYGWNMSVDYNNLYDIEKIED